MDCTVSEKQDIQEMKYGLESNKQLGIIVLTTLIIIIANITDCFIYAGRCAKLLNYHHTSYELGPFLLSKFYT